MRQVTKYVTDDGTEFDHADEAAEHEQKLKLADELRRTKTLGFDHDVNGLVKWLHEHYTMTRKD
jgi:hypothetical protein